MVSFLCRENFGIPLADKDVETNWHIHTPTKTLAGRRGEGVLASSPAVGVGFHKHLHLFRMEFGVVLNQAFNRVPHSTVKFRFYDRNNNLHPFWGVEDVQFSTA